MKQIYVNASNILFEKVESLDGEDDKRHGWKCIYVRLSDRQERFNRQLRMHFVNRAITELLSADEGYIYFCDDGDIFILFEGALKPLTDKLSSHFGDLDPDQLRGTAESGIFTFFDLNRHWQGFYNICREKAHRLLPPRERLTPAILPEAVARAAEWVNA
jgi:hypothetical protein